MRTALTALGLAVAIAASWCAPSGAQTEESYGGPRSIKFESNGALAPTLSGSVDLVAGTADLVGPCGRGVKDGSPCGPSDRRHFLLSPPDLAQLRSLAIEVSGKGLFDTDCIERQKKETELADAHQKKEAKKKQADWRRSHPGGEPPPVAAFMPIIMPPLDPYFASLEADGVGSVVSAPEVGNKKSDSRCMSPATQALWKMVLNPYAQTWPSR
jgi:hypothetical protein